MKSPLLIKKGAEADLYIANWHNRRVILKRRSRKKYRPPKMDEHIRTYRTIHEPRLMHDAKKAGVASPTVFLVDVKNATIIMEYIDGKPIKELLEETSRRERHRLCLDIGSLVGKLHEYGVIHGDLTTSNIILSQRGKVYFIDFGLGEKTKEIEARGVDLHLMKRAFQSTHFRFAAECLDAVFEGYCNILKTEVSERIFDKIEEIDRRGRYVAERKERE